MKTQHVSRVRAVQFAMTAVSCVLLQACAGDGDPVGPQAKPVSTVAVALAASQVQVGNTTQATATLRDADGATVTGRTIAWSSSSNAVATVDQNGLVTGVAPGNAQITATSETKSGSAALTVVVDPASTASVEISAITQNGQSVDLNNVAGTISIDIEETVPQGFVGTVDVRFDTMLVSRTTYPAAGVAADVRSAAASTGAVKLDRLDLNTASVTVTIAAEDLEVTPAFRNVENLLRVDMNGTVNGTAVNESATQLMTLGNPSGAVIALGRFQTSKLVIVDGKPVRGGSGLTVLTGVVDFNAIPLSAIDRVEVITGGASAVYGADAVNGVVNFITNGKSQAFTPEQMPCASLTFGTVLRVDRILRGTNVVDPQSGNPFVANGWSIDLNHNGIADINAPPAGFQLPTGIKGQVRLNDFSSTLPDGYFVLDDPFFCDNQAPVAALGSFSLLGNTNNAFQPFVLDNGQAFPAQNIVPLTFDFRRLLDPSKVSDVAGLDLETPPQIYVAPTSAIGNDIAQAQHEWQVGKTLSASLGYDYRAAVKFKDKFGQFVIVPLQATSENNIGLGGTPTTIGSEASFRLFDDAAVTFTRVGARDRSWSNSLNFNLQYRYTITGDAGVGGNTMFGSLSRNGECVGGGTSPCPSVRLPFQQTGNTVSMNLNSIWSQFGLSSEGFWELKVNGFSSGGTPFTTPTMTARYLVDNMNPFVVSNNTPVTASFSRGQTFQFNYNFGDGLHVSQGGVNFAYDLPADFDGGFAYAPFIRSPFRSVFQQRQPTLEASVTSSFPSHITLTDGLGNVSTSASDYKRVLRYDFWVLDGVDRLNTTRTFIPIDPAFVPAPDPFIGLKATISGTTNPIRVCSRRITTTSPCAAGVGEKATVTGVVTSLTSQKAANGISFVDFYMKNGATGLVYHACRASNIISEIVVGMNTETRYSCEIDIGNHKGPIGAYDVFAWFVSTTKHHAVKSQFCLMQVTQGAF